MYRLSEARRSTNDTGPAPATPASPGFGRGRSRPSEAPYAGSESRFPAPAFWDVITWLLRGWFIVALAGLVGLAGAVTFLKVVTPRYTAIADLLLAPLNLKVLPDDLYPQNLQSDSQILDIESKMRLMTSAKVLQKVVTKLDLTNSAEFKPKPSLLDFGGLFGPTSNGPAERSVARELASRIKVARVERSYLVSVSLYASDPDLAARMADTLVDAFREEIAQSDAERAGQAAERLTDRLSALKSGVTKAEADVEAFKRRHSLQQGGGGATTSAQELERMTGLVSDAQAKLADAESRRAIVEAAISEKNAQASAVMTPVLTNLYAEASALNRQIANSTQTLGPRHPALLSLKDELSTVRVSIRAELDRQRQKADSDVDQARQALTLLQSASSRLRGRVSDDDQTQVTLRELEREAKAKATLYQALLRRAGEAVERQQIDATDVRVITPATPPERPTWPPRPLATVLAGIAIGLVLGGAIAALRGYVGIRHRVTVETA